jgi:light-regulated signal transduction histidine kinase (bacteriophytochrome)
MTAALVPRGENHPAEATERLRGELEIADYVMGHDLQDPLHGILSVCEVIERQPDISPDTTKLAHMLNGEALRLKALIQGMRDYIRLETVDVVYKPVDCNEAVQAAKATLENEIKSTGATITIDTLPRVVGHYGHLTRMFAFLLENALKFHDGKVPWIHISARRTANTWEFCIADNGIGIDQDYHDIIFRLFQRLHAETYPGYGIGLGLAYKTVEMHGGRLWVESTPGQGSQFYFTLPAADGRK